MAKEKREWSLISWTLRLMGILAGFLATVSFAFPQGILIDHGCVDVSLIPDDWISQAKSRIKLHYAHTSHGGQLIHGLKRLSDPALSAYDSQLEFTHQFKALPSGPGLCIMGGQLMEYYTNPSQYWKQGGESLTRDTLDAYKEINVSMFGWCREMDKYSEADVKEYLAAISSLEKDYPRVRFVYMTGNAQAKGPGGYNRSLRNEQIRKFCRENNKTLFDFADLDVWHGGEEATYVYEGRKIPVEHPFYKGDEAGHTTFLSCETKARALWWMLARIAGWEGTPFSSTCDCNGDGIVDEEDVLCKKMEILTGLPGWSRSDWRNSPASDDTVIDRVDLIKKQEDLRRMIWIWARNCGLRE